MSGHKFMTLGSDEIRCVHCGRVFDRTEREEADTYPCEEPKPLPSKTPTRPVTKRGGARPYRRRY